MFVDHNNCKHKKENINLFLHRVSDYDVSLFVCVKISLKHHYDYLHKLVIHSEVIKANLDTKVSGGH